MTQMKNVLPSGNLVKRGCFSEELTVSLNPEPAEVNFPVTVQMTIRLVDIHTDLHLQAFCWSFSSSPNACAPLTSTRRKHLMDVFTVLHFATNKQKYAERLFGEKTSTETGLV